MKAFSCLLALVGLGCSTDTLAPRIFDAAWCDVVALPCVKISEPGNGLPASCSAPGLSAVPVSPPGGQRVCFDGSQSSAAAACALLCDPQYRDPVLFPGNTGCVASVNADATRHGALNGSGYLANSCTGYGNTTNAYLSGAGTNTVSLRGMLSVTFAGSTQSVAVKSGQLNFWAPNTDCSALDISCPVQLNQLELSLADAALPGLSLAGWTLAQDGPLLTPSGQRIAPQPPSIPNATFSFPMPAGLVFDVVGNLHGSQGDLPGFAVASDSEQSATFDVVTGRTSIDLSLATTLDGQAFSLSGSLASDSVLDLAPLIEPPAPLTLTGSSAMCSADASLTATVSSPVSLPLSVTFAVDDGAVALAGPTASGTLYGAGDHVVTIFATDSLGAATRATQAVSISCP